MAHFKDRTGEEILNNQNLTNIKIYGSLILGFMIML